MDKILEHCNETELLGLARSQGLGDLRRGLDHKLLIGLVSGAVNIRPEYMSEVRATRFSLQTYIIANYGKVSSQLPGCTGECTTYPCSDGRHAKCYNPSDRK